MCMIHDIDSLVRISYDIDSLDMVSCFNISHDPTVPIFFFPIMYFNQLVLLFLLYSSILSTRFGRVNFLTDISSIC